jgi:hypothetical protein
MHVKSAGDVYKSQISPFETAGLYLDQAARDRFVEDLANSVASALRTAIRKIIEDVIKKHSQEDPYPFFWTR